MIRLAIDAMGGDYAPDEIVKGGVLAAKKLGVKILLVGKQEQIDKLLESEDRTNIEVIDAQEDIPMDEKNPARAVRRASGSSISIANKLVAEGKADGVIAAGHTGAATAASLFYLKRIQGFERPCICTIIPTSYKRMFLIDGGSNIETTPKQMLQSALIGSILAKLLFKKDKPRIALLNVGEEEGKGTENYRNAYDLLMQEGSINFVGNVEGKTMIDDNCEVAICDGFVGNIHLKALEGGLKLFANALRAIVKKTGPVAFIGVALLKIAGVYDKLREHMHPDSYGGALLGGVNGVSIISHGSSNAEAIMNACKQAKLYVENDVIGEVKKSLAV